MRGRSRPLRCFGPRVVGGWAFCALHRGLRTMRRRLHHPRHRCPRRRPPSRPRRRHRSRRRRRPRRRRPCRRRCRPRRHVPLHRRPRSALRSGLLISGRAPWPVTGSGCACSSPAGIGWGRPAPRGASSLGSQPRRSSSWSAPPPGPTGERVWGDGGTPQVALWGAPGAEAAAEVTTVAAAQRRCPRTGTPAGEPGCWRSLRVGLSASCGWRGIASYPTCRRATEARRPMPPTRTSG